MFNLDSYIGLLATRLKQDDRFKKLKHALRRTAETHWHFERAQTQRRRFGRRRGHFLGITDPKCYDYPHTRLMALCLHADERARAAYYRAQDRRMTALAGVHRAIFDLNTAAYLCGEWEGWEPAAPIVWSAYWTDEGPTKYVTYEGLWDLVHKVVEVAAADAATKELRTDAFDIPETLRLLHARLLRKKYKVARASWFEEMKRHALAEAA